MTQQGPRWAVVAVVFAMYLTVAAWYGEAQQPAAPSDVDVRNAAEFRKLFPADAKVTKLAGGFGFTEGPVWIARDGGYLVFSDIRKNQMMKWTAKGGITTFRAPSRNANGNTLDREGRLLTAEHSGRRLYPAAPTGARQRK